MLQLLTKFLIKKINVAIINKISIKKYKYRYSTDNKKQHGKRLKINL